MAKRAPEEERDFNPIQATLVRAAAGSARTITQDAPPKETLPLADNDAPTAADLPVAAPIKPPRQQRFLLSWEDEQALGALTHELSEAVGTPVKLSNVLRSCVMLIRHSGAKLFETPVEPARSYVRPTTIKRLWRCLSIESRRFFMQVSERQNTSLRNAAQIFIDPVFSVRYP